MAGANFVEAQARAAPQLGAQWIEVAGVYALFCGPHSPVTQTFGLGLFQTCRIEDLEAIEAFFQERAAPVHHEVSPLAGQPLAAMLNERGYRPIEFSSVMFLSLSDRGDDPRADTAPIQVRLIGRDELDLWVRTAAAGWRELTALSDEMPDVLRILAGREGALAFVAEMEGRPIATASLAIHRGVALLAGASTTPEWRHRGAQRALLEARLAHARHAGCDLAMICAEPGSASQRNGERQGFRIAYTRIKWGLGVA
jgi:GNAT superfamily N-acetyltransferase